MICPGKAKLVRKSSLSRSSSEFPPPPVRVCPGPPVRPAGPAAGPARRSGPPASVRVCVPGRRPGRRSRSPKGSDRCCSNGFIVLFLRRESDIQRTDTNFTFQTPGNVIFCQIDFLSLDIWLSCLGIYYRPDTLKSMTCLLGNSEKRQVYDNFELQNLNSNKHDYTHITYQKYLETNYFVVPNEDSFWAHMMTNQLPQAPSGTADKGLFNCFPLCLTSDDLFKTPSSNIGEPSFFLTRLTSLQTPPLHPCSNPDPCFFRRDFIFPFENRIGIFTSACLYLVSLFYFHVHQQNRFSRKPTETRMYGVSAEINRDTLSKLTF